MKRLLVLTCPLLLCASLSQAASLDISLELPRADVAEYHKPYLAVWLAQPSGEAVLTIALWYDTKKANKGGEKWLKDLRQWWRRRGRSLTELPVDGYTGATQGPGKHHISLNASQLGSLKPGQYLLQVEAAREAGGREMLSIPLQWPVTKATSHSAKGSLELGTVTVTLQP